MRIHYSKEADALYIRFRESQIDNTDELADDIIVDFDKGGTLVGIEILAFSEKADLDRVIIQAFADVQVETA